MLEGYRKGPCWNLFLFMQHGGAGPWTQGLMHGNSSTTEVESWVSVWHREEVYSDLLGENLWLDAMSSQ